MDAGRPPLPPSAPQLMAIVRRHWNFTGDIDVVPINAGLNNPTFQIHASERRRYAARLYRNLDVLSICREHALLDALSGAGLHFSLPVPARCRDGTTFAQTPHGCLALFDWIDGAHANPADPQHLAAVGAALADLDEALLRLDATLARLPGEPARGHGQLHAIHPAVPDAGILAQRLAQHPHLAGISSEISWLGEAIAECLETGPRLYAVLPQQWIHQDLALSNVLQVGGRITGLLDFEFSDRDLRALDLVALLTNTVGGFADQTGWQQAEALCRGYCAGVRLTQPEIDAIPDLMRLRYVVANIHGAGRWLAGLNPTEEVIRRLRHGAACDRLIRRDADRMRRLVQSASSDDGAQAGGSTSEGA